jgi:probable rRNA maturation factor
MRPPDETAQPAVIFSIRSRRIPRRQLQQYAARLAREVGGGRPFSCLIAGDSELHRLNREFLGKDRPTDVLSFPSGTGAGNLGDLAISAERASEQAYEHGHSLVDEIKILMLHGVLHLLGLDHERDRGAMRRAELRWRHKLELPASLIERAG